MGSRVDSIVGGLPSESQLNCGTREFCVARVLEIRCKAEFLTACYRSLGFLGRRWAECAGLILMGEMLFCLLKSPCSLSSYFTPHFLS